MRVSKHLIPASMVAIIAASVAATQPSGQWVSSGGQALSHRIAAGETIRPDDIKGWMTFQEVATTYGIPIDELMKGLGVEGTPVRSGSGVSCGVHRRWG